MNAIEVLNNVNDLIAEGELYKARFNYPKKWKIDNVYNKLGIFDWWNETLSMTQLKQMRDFLITAMNLGFNGYVCFKVGAKYCSHGMWAHKAESTDGYSPKGACLFHSFRSGDNYWDMCRDDDTWIHTNEKDEFTLKEIKELLSQEVAQPAVSKTQTNLINHNWTLLWSGENTRDDIKYEVWGHDGLAVVISNNRADHMMDMMIGLYEQDEALAKAKKFCKA